jgi:uncharacterized membrane protein YczE
VTRIALGAVFFGMVFVACNLLSIQNSLKQGDVFASLLISFALEYTIKMVQEIDGWD